MYRISRYKLTDCIGNWLYTDQLAYTPALLHPYTLTPLHPYTPTPLHHYTPVPLHLIHSYTPHPTPQNSHTSTPLHPHTPHPYTPHSTPLHPHTPHLYTPTPLTSTPLHPITPTVTHSFLYHLTYTLVSLAHISVSTTLHFSVDVTLIIWHMISCISVYTLLASPPSVIPPASPPRVTPHPGIPLLSSPLSTSLEQ